MIPYQNLDLVVYFVALVFVGWVGAGIVAGVLLGWVLKRRGGEQ